MHNSPFQVITEMEQNHIDGDTRISEYVTFSLKDNVDKIEAYLNSKHISGDKDSLGRDKPFFNIVTAASNVWYRATDIDRANIRIKSTKSSGHILAMVANVLSQEWMRKSNFGVFLNKWGKTLADYGSAVTKWVEVDGELVPSVVPWNRLMVDPVKFENSPKVEKHYVKPSELRKNKAYNQEVVKELLTATTARKLLSRDTVDSKNEDIEVYELHGEFPLSWLTDKDSDEDTFVQQVWICSLLKGAEGEKDTEYCLYSGREEDPYIITHLIEMDGRTMSIGAVEHLFEAQWMVNHNEKAIKDQLDLASKLIFQTADPDYAGKNVHMLDTGSILSHGINTPLTQLANNSHDIASLQNSGQNWKNQAAESTSTPDAIRGNTMPSSTAARQVEALQQESHSLFEQMTENKGLAIEGMWRMKVIPYLKKKMNTTEEIAATLDEHNIKQIDSLFVPNVVKKRVAEVMKKEMFKVLNTPIEENPQFPELPDEQAVQADVLDEMKALGNQRYFKPSDVPTVTWKEALEDLEWDAEVEVTSEAHDKQATLTTLTTVLREIAGMGDIENAKMVLNKILEETGIFSPMELVSQMATQPAPSQMTPEQLPSTTAQTQNTQTPVTQT